jgi:hypothetical protein
MKAKPGRTSQPYPAIAGAMTSRRALLLFQLAATAAALGWVPGNAAKLAVMAVIWAIGFRRISRTEWLLVLCVNGFFVLMNLAALRKGIFHFEHPDLLGMPAFEYFMWGFYTLHTLRLLGGTAPGGRPLAALAMGAVFALPFSTVADPGLLALASATALAASLAVFHDRADFAYAGYMAALGAVIEHVGVGTGQWAYPGTPFGGVPIWSVPMWAGIGLFTRRLLLPVLARSKPSPLRPRVPPDAAAASG